MHGTSWLSPKKKRTGWQRNVRTITNLKRKDMEKKYENLRQKTVFDFCDDANLIKEITGVSLSNKNDGYSKEYYLSFSDHVKVLHILDFATITSNIELKKAASRELKIIEEEIDKYEKETGEICD